MKTRYWLMLLAAILLLTSLSPSPVYSQGQAPVTPQSITLPGGSGPSLNVVAPAAGGSGFVMLHASDFSPESSNMVFLRSLVLQTLTTSPSSVGYRYTAPVELPQGATVTQITLYYRDNDPAQLIYLTLWKMGLPGASAGGMASISTPLAGTTGDSFLQTSTISGNPIDNQSNAYYLEVTIPPNALINTLFLAAVRIDYTYTTTLPAVVK